MSVENLKTRQELRDLVDAYAYLGDDKKIDEQMELFTPDATYKVYMNGIEVANTTGTETLKKEFSTHAVEVKTYFTLNGQHTAEIDGNDATGISFSQLKMVREKDGKNIITDYSVKYEDAYIFQNGKWLIRKRIGHFLIIETRTLNNDI